MRQLSPERVDGLFRHFEAGRSIRGAARLAGVARRTASRWRRVWAASAGRETLVCRVSGSCGAFLRAEAARRRMSQARLAAVLLEAIAGDELVGVILGESAGGDAG